MQIYCTQVYDHVHETKAKQKQKLKLTLENSQILGGREWMLAT